MSDKKLIEEVRQAAKDIWKLEPFEMYYKGVLSNIKLIKKTAKKVWGKKCVFGELKVLKSNMYPTFEWLLTIYGEFGIKLEYEASMLCIRVFKDGEYVYFGRLTEKNILSKLEFITPKILLHDFKILDEVLKQM